MAEPTIYIVDEVVTKPGQARGFIDRYLAEYAPGAEQRGMTLDRVLVSPPIWFTDQENTVTISWTVPGAGAWWGMTARGRHDASIREFWTAIEELVQSRSRRMMAAAADVDGLNNV
jgi:hypothetical protein